MMISSTPATGGRNRVHEYGRGVLGAPAGHVDARTLEGREALAGDGTIIARREPRLLQLALVELGDIVSRVLD